MLLFMFKQEKTGGKVIYSKGGVIFLFRGRNYNYKTRPRYPLMLWKPATPVYPKLVKRAPEGLTLEETTEMRKKGRQLPPIRQLGKNGVYINLVKDVREAFEACELVRINCKSLNKNDVRKIGAKLKDLVPCVLISFEYEHILMWRGKDWKSSLVPPADDLNEAARIIPDDSITTSSNISELKEQEPVELLSEKSLNKELVCGTSHENMTLNEDVCMAKSLKLFNPKQLAAHSLIITSQSTVSGIGKISDKEPSPENCSHFISVNGLEEIKDFSNPSSDNPMMTELTDSIVDRNLIATDSAACNNGENPQTKCLEGVILLLNKAVDDGSAIILDQESLDANVVYERSLALAKSAPAGPIFKTRIRKAVPKAERENTQEYKEQANEVQAMELEAITIPGEIIKRRSNESNSRIRKRQVIKEVLPDVVPHGSLRVDELAKLLA